MRWPPSCETRVGGILVHDPFFPWIPLLTALCGTFVAPGVRETLGEQAGMLLDRMSS
jgi:hypothetical protein